MSKKPQVIESPRGKLEVAVLPPLERILGSSLLARMFNVDWQTVNRWRDAGMPWHDKRTRRRSAGTTIPTTSRPAPSGVFRTASGRAAGRPPRNRNPTARAPIALPSAGEGPVDRKDLYRGRSDRRREGEDHGGLGKGPHQPLKADAEFAEFTKRLSDKEDLA